MDNRFKETYDRASMLKDISDREQMINNFRRTGYLDRDKAIQKIQELRLSDTDVAAATTARLSISSTPYSQVTDQGIKAEIQMQLEILSAKTLKIQ